MHHTLQKQWSEHGVLPGTELEIKMTDVSGAPIATIAERFVLTELLPDLWTDFWVI